MINTHPDVFGSGVVAPFLSALNRCGVDLFSLPSRVERGMAVLGPEGMVEGDADATADSAKTFVPCLPALLPIRRRGTRVWIFCSKFLTLARISETIWTPRLFVAVMGRVLIIDTADVEGDVRLGRGIGARREFREAEKVGNVPERETGVGVE